MESTLTSFVSKEASSVARLPSGRSFSDDELVEGLNCGNLQASAAFFDAYCDRVNRLVWRLLGADPEHDDVVNAAFAAIFSSIRTLKDPQALPCWVSTITINTVRREIRSRRYRRLLSFSTDTPGDYGEARERPPEDVVGRVFAVLETMTADNRIVFALRYLEGHTFEEIAVLRCCSLATAKRYGKKCRAEFMRKARRDLVLSGYIEEPDDV